MRSSTAAAALDRGGGAAHLRGEYKGHAAFPHCHRTRAVGRRYRLAGAVADRHRSTARRYCHSARRHELLLSDRHLHPHQRRLERADVAVQPVIARRFAGADLVKTNFTTAPRSQSITATALISTRQRGSVASRTTCTVVVAGFASLKYSPQTRLSAS